MNSAFTDTSAPWVALPSPAEFGSNLLVAVRGAVLCEGVFFAGDAPAPPHPLGWGFFGRWR